MKKPLKTRAQRVSDIKAAKDAVEAARVAAATAYFATLPAATRSIAILLLLAHCGCAGESAPGTGPTCAGPAEDCARLFRGLAVTDEEARSEGFLGVAPLIDYTIVAGGGWSEPGVLGGALICGLNTPELTLHGIRCVQQIAATDPRCGADPLRRVATHEYLHCAVRFSGVDWDGDPRHEDCAIWGTDSATCDGAGGSVVERLRAAWEREGI